MEIDAVILLEFIDGASMKTFEAAAVLLLLVDPSNQAICTTLRDLAPLISQDIFSGTRASAAVGTIKDSIKASSNTLNDVLVWYRIESKIAKARMFFNYYYLINKNNSAKRHRIR